MRIGDLIKLKKPEVLYPTLVKGWIKGQIRCESLDGSELWLPPIEGEIYMPPFERDGKTWFVTHLQKKASYFSLLYSPFIYHYGRFWKTQQKDAEGHWIPNSEQGIYWRSPGWRFDLDPKLESPWILSGGRIPGLHID